MQTSQVIRCPDCGSLAQRHYLMIDRQVGTTTAQHRLIQTECASCDYFIVTCADSGNVIEACAAGIFSVTTRDMAAAGLF